MKRKKGGESVTFMMPDLPEALKMLQMKEIMCAE
jgi:hypothetical protein